MERVTWKKKKKKKSKISVAKRQRKEIAHKNLTKEGVRTRVRTSGDQTALLASPIYVGGGLGGGEKHI